MRKMRREGVEREKTGKEGKGSIEGKRLIVTIWIPLRFNPLKKLKDLKTTVENSESSIKVLSIFLMKSIEKRVKDFADIVETTRNHHGYKNLLHAIS